MKKSLNICALFLVLMSQSVFAASSDSAQGLPWEGPIAIIQKSLSYVGGILILIGILWAGYTFLMQGEKEQGFKRLITTVIGGAVMLGASTIVSVCFGATF